MEFSFQTSSATVRTGRHKESANHDFITLVLGHRPHESLKTPDGLDLTTRRWSIQLYESEVENENVESKGAIGVFTVRDASCAGWAAIGPKAFARLLEVLTAGRMPFQVNVEFIPEMDGRVVLLSPQGRAVVWDVDASQSLYVVGVTLSMPVGAPWTGEDGTSETSALPVTQVDLESSAGAIQRTLKAIAVSLVWIAVGVALLVAKAVLFR